MNDLIQKLIEIDSLDAQIQSLRLENPSSTWIAPRKEERDRLLKEAFTSLGREYEETHGSLIAPPIHCGVEKRLEKISCSICGESLYVDEPQYPLGESFSAECNGCHHIEEVANTSPATRSGSFQAVKPLIELSPGTTKNLDVDWLIEHIDDGYDFDEIYKEAEEDGLNTFYFFYLRELLEEQQINIDLLRGLSRGDLRKLLTEKITEYDFLVQKAGFAELLEDAESNAYHVKRMVVLLKEAAAAIAASGSNPEILAKLQGYVDLSN
jgi:hypothetical protein